MAKKRIEQNENIFVKYQKLKKAEEIFKKYETITLSDIYVVISRFLPETENYNSFKGAVGDNPPNLIPSKKLDNDSKSSIITEERNNVQKEEELNTQKTSKSSCSSKELTEDLLQEKERILAFFEANKERGITRTEITAYLAVKEYRTAKKKIKALGIPDVLKYVVDLRSSISVPAGSPIYPDGYTSVNRIEDNKISSKQDENSSKQDENGSKQDENSSKQDENSSKQDENGSKQDENGLKQDENSSKQDEIISKHDENDIQKKEESKRVVALETQSFEKKDDSKSVLLLSELFGVQQKKQNYIIGLDLFNQRLSLFLELLDELLKPERIPCFWLWESDLIELDKLKEESALARNLIKFFAQDERDYYSHLVDGPKPKNMIEFCKKNDITFITGVPIDILNFKLEGAKVKIPSFYKKLFPSPFDSKGKVLGFDSCVAFLKKEDIIPLLSGAKTILLSDVQVREIPNNSYILKVCAYYGKVKKAEPQISGIADQTIVNFYKNNVVDIVYTMDSGFMVFAKFAKIHCEFIKDKSGVTSSKIFEKIDSIFSGEFKLDKIEQRIIRYDLKVNTYDGRFRIYTDSVVSVYSKNKYKRTSPLPYIEVFKDDYVIIRKNGKVLVSIVTSPSTAIGRVLFFGLESNLPKEFKMFN